jgi:putative ABC transport system permease protein
MQKLDAKLLRDLRRMWAQSLAIALVIAGGVATLIMAVGSARSLLETRNAFYERNNFADVFAQVRRAPRTVLEDVSRISGVALVDARISKLAVLDIPGLREPATGQFVSLPDSGEPLLNRLYMKGGRLPEPGKVDEVVVSESFANSHRFDLGSGFSAILNGRKRALTVVGIALSAEFIYAVGPGDIIPDDRRFGVIWMSERGLAAIYDLEGAFSSLYVKLSAGADESEVCAQIDNVLDRYGGTAAYGRKYQISHAWLDHELDMLRNMSRTLPPIFLLVSAFLVNLTMTRLVALEREQIGLFKALGFSNWAVAEHYCKFVVLIVFAGIAIGSVAGTLLGTFITRLFGDFFRFPFLIFEKSPDLYVFAGLLGMLAALLGAVRALREVLRLAPAVAMQPPAPPVFRHVILQPGRANALLSQRVMMMVRNVAHHPARAFFTLLGLSLSTAILIVSLYTRGTMEELINVTFYLSDRQDATVSFPEKKSVSALYDVARLPGVMTAEPYREVPVRIRKGHIERRIVVSGRPREAHLRQIIDVNLHRVDLPEGGLAISALLAEILHAKVGDDVEIDLLEGQHRTITVPISALVEDYFGIRGMMDDASLSRLMRETPSINSVNVSVDMEHIDDLYAKVKELPSVGGMALQRASLQNFRTNVAMLITIIAGIYTTLATIIAFGVVYNSARISLSERARELASLRVLGFTPGEVLRILLLELGFLTVLAQPLGWLMGYGLAWITRTNLAGEIMRVRLFVETSTYAIATGIVLIAALFSALVVGRRVFELDLVAVLKSRD